MAERRKGQGNGEPKNSPRMVNGVEREGQAVALRIAGRTLVEIAVALGYAGKQGAAAAIKRALERIGSPEVAEYRELTTARLEKVLSTWWPDMINPALPRDERLKATDRILRAITDMRLLHGLDIAKLPGSTPDDPLYVAPALPGEIKLDEFQVEALIALDAAKRGKVVDMEKPDGRNGHGSGN